MLNTPGWTYGEFDLSAIHRVRQNGVVLGRQHWTEQDGRDGTANIVKLR
jgi:hypothetical protein